MKIILSEKLYEKLVQQTCMKNLYGKLVLSTFILNYACLLDILLEKFTKLDESMHAARRTECSQK
jgi:hypothetical protein